MLDIWARGTRTARICDHHQAIAQQPPRRPTRASAVDQRGDQGKPRQHIWTIGRINLLRISCNKPEIQYVSLITLSVTKKS
jgi:hypothetical protein